MNFYKMRPGKFVFMLVDYSRRFLPVRNSYESLKTQNFNIFRTYSALFSSCTSEKTKNNDSSITDNTPSEEQELHVDDSNSENINNSIPKPDFTHFDEAQQSRDKNDMDKPDDFKKTANLQAIKIRELQDKLLFALAEIENNRKIHLRELENSKVYAITNFAKSIVDVADNLSLAISSIKSHIDENPDSKKIIDGILLTEKALLSVFEKFGIERYDPINKPFDPKLHEALFEIEDTTKETGVIAQVLQVGYRLNNRILRAAKVGVVKKSTIQKANK